MIFLGFHTSVHANQLEEPETSDHYGWTKNYLDRNDPLSGDENSTPQYKSLLIQTGYTTIFGVAAIAYIWNQDESVSNWNKSELSKTSSFENYKHHVSSPPKYDNDDNMTNYVMHPLAGATYYTMCRQNALGPLSCFGYSFAMSTFFWEYGLEAVFEVPSKQDLWVTPIGGTIIGEGFHQIKQAIKRNQRMVFGSKALGSVTMFLLDPLGASTAWMHDSILSLYPTTNSEGNGAVAVSLNMVIK